jgi:hypothetical protein
MKKNKFLLHGLIMNPEGLMDLSQFTEIMQMLNFGAYKCTIFVRFTAIPLFSGVSACFWLYNLK